MKHRSLACGRAILAATLMATATLSQAASGWSLNILSSLDNQNAYATGINNAGEVIGTSNGLVLLPFTNQYSTAQFGARWAADGTLQSLGTDTRVTDIANTGLMSGSVAVSQPWYGSAVIRSATSTQTVTGNAEGMGINDLGQMALMKYVLSRSAYSATNGVVWDGQSLTTLPSLGGSYTWVKDINNQGVVVGESQGIGSCVPQYCTPEMFNSGSMHAAMWVNGQVTDLGTLGGKTSVALHVNDAGVAVGQAQASDGSQHAVAWYDGRIADLGLGSAMSINAAGQIVGTNGQGQAVLWDAGQMILLDSLLGSGDWALTAATGINDLGVIAGNAMNKSTGAMRAFVLSPVPEPSSVALFGLGLALLAAGAARRKQRGH